MAFKKLLRIKTQPIPFFLSENKSLNGRGQQIKNILNVDFSLLPTCLSLDTNKIFIFIFN